MASEVMEDLPRQSTLLHRSHATARARGKKGTSATKKKGCATSTFPRCPGAPLEVQRSAISSTTFSMARRSRSSLRFSAARDRAFRRRSSIGLLNSSTRQRRKAPDEPDRSARKQHGQDVVGHPSRFRPHGAAAKTIGCVTALGARRGRWVRRGDADSRRHPAIDLSSTPGASIDSDNRADRAAADAIGPAVNRNRLDRERPLQQSNRSIDFSRYSNASVRSCARLGYRA